MSARDTDPVSSEKELSSAAEIETAGHCQVGGCRPRTVPNSSRDGPSHTLVEK